MWEADICIVRPSIGYKAELFFFGFNYMDWVDGWPVLVEGTRNRAPLK